MDPGSKEVGYRSPPQSTRFKRGKSGNPKGRPPTRRREAPYEAVLGQVVTIREDGRERRVTAAEAFLLHLTKRGLEGDSAAARASLAAIETARGARLRNEPLIGGIIVHYVDPGSVGPGLAALGMAIKLKRYSADAFYKLKPWIVEAALTRLGDRRLTMEEQGVVLRATHLPNTVRWPEWWSVFGPVETALKQAAAGFQGTRGPMIYMGAQHYALA